MSRPDLIAFAFLCGLLVGIGLSLIAHWLSERITRATKPLPGVDVSESDWATFQDAQRSA